MAYTLPCLLVHSVVREATGCTINTGRSQEPENGRRR